MKLSDLFETKPQYQKDGIVIQNTKGRPIGEIYPIKQGPFTGQWGNFHYAMDDGYEPFDTKEDAFGELKQMHKEYSESRKMANNPLVKNI